MHLHDKNYARYLSEEPEWAARAEKVAERLHDLTSFIVNHLGITDVGQDSMGVQYSIPPAAFLVSWV